MRRCLRREERVPRSNGPKVQESQGPGVQGLKDQDISKSHSNTSLTLKKVHLVTFILMLKSYGVGGWWCN